ncbi:MAG: amino acid adenylation domain-containing protein, partial [bacterium]|nr:amino acid adenylation domain-containing protein [bacterium]
MNITYRELDEKSNLPASRLQNKGVRPGSIVGIKTERTVEMMIGILAVLKAGGAYLPIDPDYPSERIRYMLADSNVRILLSDTGEAGDAGEGGGQVECIDVRNCRGSGDLVSPASTHPDCLAYIIYTSGSTGKPKGVMIQHASILNFIKGMTDIIKFKPQAVILSLTTICFDIFGLETLLPLTTGT